MPPFCTIIHSIKQAPTSIKHPVGGVKGSTPHVLVDEREQLRDERVRPGVLDDVLRDGVERARAPRPKHMDADDGHTQGIRPAELDPHARRAMCDLGDHEVALTIKEHGPAIEGRRRKLMRKDEPVPSGELAVHERFVQLVDIAVELRMSDIDAHTRASLLQEQGEVFVFLADLSREKKQEGDRAPPTPPFDTSPFSWRYVLVASPIVFLVLFPDFLRDRSQSFHRR